MRYLRYMSSIILFSVGLTSCWQQSGKQKPDLPASTAKKATNIVYFNTIATRTDDAKTLLHTYLQQGNIIVDFYADWCPPCQLLGSVIEQVAPQFPALTFLKINVDQYPSISEDIRSIPTLLFYKNGAQVLRSAGAKDKKALTALLKEWYE